LPDASGEALDRELGRVPRPASCRIHPTSRVTHPRAAGRIRRGAGSRNRQDSASWEMPDASGETGGASNRPLEVSGETPDGETGRVSAYGEMLDASGEPGDPSNDPLDASGETLARSVTLLESPGQPSESFRHNPDAFSGVLETASEFVRRVNFQSICHGPDYLQSCGTRSVLNNVRR
jgi:hypothetical protein